MMVDFCLVFFRYWLFSDLVPGLYIEKGWVHESIEYNFTPPNEKQAELDEVDTGSDTGNPSQGTEPDQLLYLSDVKHSQSSRSAYGNKCRNFFFLFTWPYS